MTKHVERLAAKRSFTSNSFVPMFYGCLKVGCVSYNGKKGIRSTNVAVKSLVLSPCEEIIVVEVGYLVI